MNTNLFEEYLKTQHASQYRGLDDDMSDDFDDWLSLLDIEEWLNFGEQFMKEMIEELKELHEYDIKEIDELRDLYPLTTL